MYRFIATALALAALGLPAIAQDSFKDLQLPKVWQGEKETIFGPMEFDHGMPLRESAEKMYEKLDAYRATELFLWSQPIVSFAVWRDQARQKHPGFANRSTLHVKTYDDRVGVLTINQSSEYFISFVNTDDDATVIEVPPGIVVGLVTDFWQRGLTDLGVFSVNAGGGGTYVLHGPRTPKDKIPDIKGATVLETETSNTFVLMRFIQIEGETPVADLQSQVKIYAASEESGIDLVPGGDKPLQGYPPRDMAYWEYLHEVLQEEDTAERDRFMMYIAHTLGIERGKPFEPTEAQKAALMAGLASGEAVAKTFVFNERLEGVLRKDGWRAIISGSLPDAFEHTQRVRDFDLLDPRSRYTYEAISVSPRMGHPVPGRGQAYAGMFEDSDDNRLVGSAKYVMRFDPPPPAELFWSVVIYDVESRTLIVNETQNATVGSRATPDLQTNDDGSVDVYVGPTPPPGKESNWVQSVPGRGWFPYVRMYGPGPDWFDQDAFALPKIEKTDW